VTATGRALIIAPSRGLVISVLINYSPQQSRGWPGLTCAGSTVMLVGVVYSRRELLLRYLRLVYTPYFDDSNYIVGERSKDWFGQHIACTELMVEISGRIDSHSSRCKTLNSLH
jgi:hypothetical protein